MFVLVFGLFWSLLLVAMGIAFMQDPGPTESARVGLGLIVAAVVWAAICLVAFSMYRSERQKEPSTTGDRPKSFWDDSK